VSKKILISTPEVKPNEFTGAELITVNKAL